MTEYVKTSHEEASLALNEDIQWLSIEINDFQKKKRIEINEPAQFSNTTRSQKVSIDRLG